VTGMTTFVSLVSEFLYALLLLQSDSLWTMQVELNLSDRPYHALGPDIGGCEGVNQLSGRSVCRREFQERHAEKG